MTAERARLGELRDQALRDLVELDRQVSDGEIPPEDANGLRRRYEQTAARALAALEELDTTEPAPAGAAPRRRSRTVLAAYVGAGLAALVAAGVLLPRAVDERPPGGFVTGNDAVQAPSLPTGNPAPGTVADLEAMVEDNPGALASRLLLAQVYTERGAYEQAARHYSEVLRRDPDNPEALAHLGWLLMQADRPQQAARLVNQALAAESPPLDALWFKANIALYGLDKPDAALAALQRMRQRGNLTPGVRAQVDQLAQTARKRQPGSGR